MQARDFPFCSPRFAAMAHRGGPTWGPNLGKENTLAAFTQAVSLGYRYIETDVQATRDGQLVCMHDSTLARMCGIKATVADFTAVELRSLAVAGGEPIPFFADVLDALPQTRFNVDLKTVGAVEPMVHLAGSATVRERILVDSFSQIRLSRFRALTRGTVATAMAPVGVAWTVFIPYLSQILASPGVAVQLPYRLKAGPINLAVVTAALVARVHRMGKAIHVWTINEPEDMERLIDLGVDGIITDRPDLLKEILLRRDLW